MNESPKKANPKLNRWISVAAIAFVIGYGTFVLVILPAGYGVDATGFGKLTGLTRFYRSTHAKPLPTTAEIVESEPVIQRDRPFQTGEMELHLDAGEGAEIKAVMMRGDRFVFSWTTEGGPVDFDMHGDAVGAVDDEFTSYWEDQQKSEGHGIFVAPFDGNHGWFWSNEGDTPVTVRVRVAGWYQKLFKH